MDPQTACAIYAVAKSSPAFDLNNFGSHSDITCAIFGNPMVQNVYEMGSIIKPLTPWQRGRIDSGAITLQLNYLQRHRLALRFDTKKICNYDYAARGVIPMQQILSQSLNVGASFACHPNGAEQSCAIILL